MQHLSPTINRIGYVAFTLLGIVKPILSHDFTEATTLGVALIFDPFDPNVPPGERPWWQQAMLYTQVAASFAAVGVMLFK